MIEPHYRTGKICYIEIPATDIAQSADFYQQSGLEAAEAQG